MRFICFQRSPSFRDGSSETRLTQLVALCLLCHFPLASSVSEASVSHVTATAVAPPLLAGSEFEVQVLGGGFDPQNDKIILVPNHNSTCGLAAPPPGSPDSVSGYAAISCAESGSAASRLICKGLRVYAPGRYKVCVCDADGNVTKALPQLINPSTSGCASLERFFVTATLDTTIEIFGPNHASTVDWRAGVNEQLWIKGTELSSSDRIRIVDESLSCYNVTHNKSNHIAVGGNPLAERDSDSNKRIEKWVDVQIFKTGTYRVCWCGDTPDGCDLNEHFIVHASTIVVAGPVPMALPLTCVTGVHFGIRLDGQGLSDDDRILIIPGHNTCGQSAGTMLHLHGARGQRTEGSSLFSKWDGVVLDGSGSTKICWCGAMSSSCGNCCQNTDEFNVWAGNITVGGPRQSRFHRPPLGVPFTYSIEGWGLSTRDRISIVDHSQLCNTDGAEKWSDGVYRPVDHIGQPPRDTVGADPINKTSQSWHNIVLKSMRTYRVCWCARNFNKCQEGRDYALAIGLILPTGPQNMTAPMSVIPNLPFDLTIHGEQGSKFSIDDRVRIVRKDVVLGVCGNSGTRTQADEVAFTACSPDCVYSPISKQPALLDGNETATWTPTKLTGSGTFLICWCPNGNNGCTRDEDFLIQAGVIKSAGVDQYSFKCAAYLGCMLHVPQSDHLGKTDAMQLIVEAPGTKCGITLRVDASLFSRGTRIDALPVAIDGENKLEFSFGSPKTTGLFKVCYCQSVDGCGTDANFFQDVGLLTISGVTSDASVFVCYVRTKCVLRVNGMDLAATDTIVLNSPSSPCGTPGVETSFFSAPYLAGTDLSKRYTGTLLGMDETSHQVWDFELGLAPRTGNFRICFCSSGMVSSQQCNNRFNHAQQVGEVKVRGTEYYLDRTCSQGSTCVFKLRSLKDTFTTMDRVLMIDENSTCGDVHAKVPAWVTPMAPFIIDADMQQLHLEAASFRIGIAIPGKYRLCYCAEVPGAESCLKSGGGRRLSTQEVPNLIRYGLDTGKLNIQGAMKDLRLVPDLPSTKSAVSVEVDMQQTGKVVTCVATQKQAPDGFIPLRSDIENCVNDEAELTERQKLFPRCVGVGKTPSGTTAGWNFVHIPAVALTKLYVWCYTEGECDSDRCLLPPNNRGLEATLTTGLVSQDNRWTSTVSTRFSLSVELTPAYQVAPKHARIKIIKHNEDCNFQNLFPGVKPLTCIASAVGKCEPAPRQFLAGARRELVWDNIIVPRGGDTTVCYCDRHYGQACDRWHSIGTLTTNGPLYAGQANYVGNPGKPFKITVKGKGLSITNRLRILPAKTDCASPAADTRTGQPSQFNDTFESFDITMPQLGESTVCWCGGQSASCVDPSEYTVLLGPLNIQDKSDCVLSEWWTVGPCSEPCGGGTQSLRRGVSAPPTGGGQECPSEDQLHKLQECNTNPCALARVDSIWTVPAEVYEMQPFQIHLSGNSFNPKEDKILLVGSDVVCGESEAHFGGADCSQTGSDSSMLICGDGRGAIRVGSPGLFKVCLCDASAAVVTSFDGSTQISTGSMASGSLTGAGCSTPKFFRLSTAAADASVISVLKAPTDSADEGSDGLPTGLAISLICSGIALLVCACVGTWLYCRVKAKTKTFVEDDSWEDEEAGEAGLVANQGAPPLQALTAPPGMQALADQSYWAQYQQHQHQLAAMQALANAQPMMALTNGLEAPPPTPYGPLSLAPPPTAPPKLLSMPPSLSPRPGSTSPRGRPGSSKIQRRKTFGDLVNEAQKENRTFSQMNLTPLPTPTGTPRESTTPRGGTPRGGTPRGMEADRSMLAIEDDRPETRESEGRPLSQGSAFNTGDSWRPNTTGDSWRPSTGDSEYRPTSAASTLSDFSSVSTHQPPTANEPSVPKLALIPTASTGNGPLPGIEEHPQSASSRNSEDSLAHSESTVGGGHTKSVGGRQRLANAEASKLTQSALQAHTKAIQEEEEEEGATPRTEPGSTPRAVKSIFGGVSRMFGGSRKSKGKSGEVITPGRSWVSDESARSDASKPSKGKNGETDVAPKRSSLNKTFPLPPEPEAVKLEATLQPPEPVAFEKPESPPSQSLPPPPKSEPAELEVPVRPPEPVALERPQALESDPSTLAPMQAPEPVALEKREKPNLHMKLEALPNPPSPTKKEKHPPSPEPKTISIETKAPPQVPGFGGWDEGDSFACLPPEPPETAALQSSAPTPQSAFPGVFEKPVLPPPVPPSPEVFEAAESRGQTSSPPEPPPVEVIDTQQSYAQASSPPDPPPPEVIETSHPHGHAPPEPPSVEVVDGVEERAQRFSPPKPAQFPPKPPTPEVVEAQHMRGQPQPPPKPPVPEVSESPLQQRGQPPPPPKPPEREPSPITRESMPAPPSKSLRKQLLAMPGSPLSVAESPSNSAETPLQPPQPPPPPRSPKASRPSIGPGPSFEAQQGNHRSGHSLHGLLAKERNHSREPSHDTHVVETPAPVEAPSLPPPPPKPPKQNEAISPRFSRGPGPGLSLDTDLFEDTIHSTGSGQSSKGSPSGKKAFSLQAMARKGKNDLPRHQSEAKAKTRPSSAVGPREVPSPSSKPDGNQQPPPPPRPPSGKPTTSPKGGSSFNAW